VAEKEDRRCEVSGKANRGLKSVNLPTVLVLEPDVLLRTSIGEFLRECGYQVIEGVSADDARSYLRSGQRLDVIYSEVRLLGTENGFSLATSLRQTHPGIDVILTSGTTDAAEKSSELCQEGPLKKPYHPQDVLTRIRLLQERDRTSME
jgi:DNA-binding response OmpR family regulator